MNNLPSMPVESSSFFRKLLSAKTLVKLLKPLELLTKSQVIPSDNTNILVQEHLTKSALDSLLENKIAAVYIPKYFKEDVASKISQHVINQELRNWHVSDLKQEYMESDFFVFGMPFNMAFKNNHSWQTYFLSTDKVRSLFADVIPEEISPIDRIMSDIKNYFDHGIKIRNYENFPMTPGLVRVMYGNNKSPAEFPLNCHVDCIPILSSKRGQFTANLYLHVPNEGGELYLWNPNLRNYFHMLKNWYFFKHFFLTPNYLIEKLQKNLRPYLSDYHKIKVNNGDLIIFNSARPHAIANFDNGHRISYQAFLNYEKNKPIEIWA